MLTPPPLGGGVLLVSARLSLYGFLVHTEERGGFFELDEWLDWFGGHGFSCVGFAAFSLVMTPRRAAFDAVRLLISSRHSKYNRR